MCICNVPIYPPNPALTNPPKTTPPPHTQDFLWAGGATVPVKKGHTGLLTVNFKLEGDVEGKKEYYIDALLTKDKKDYKT